MGVRQDKLALRKLSLFYLLKSSQATVPLKDCGIICTAGASMAEGQRSYR
jgi:hypothetical protein